VRVLGIVRIVVVLVFCLGAVVSAQTALPLAIVDETLPSIDAGMEVRISLHARGGVPPYRWSVASGDLPTGIALAPDGFLVGRAAQPGPFAVTLTVQDSGHPANSINKEFHIQVSASLLFAWLRPPQIRGNRIDGAAQVSNGSKEDFDLTVIIVAVNEVGRATALAYQHVMLKAGSENLQIPLDATLPRGAYIVHADAVAEVQAKNAILRRQLETPAPLAVTQGP
jgi:hypothetical protein